MEVSAYTQGSDDTGFAQVIKTCISVAYEPVVLLLLATSDSLSGHRKTVPAKYLRRTWV